MKKKTDSSQLVGEDSFLDVIANLVGVLIILVAVVSVQAGKVKWETPQEHAQSEALQEAEQAVWQREQTSNKLNAYCSELTHRIRQVAVDAQNLEAVRRQLLHEQVLREREWEQQLAQQSEQDRLAAARSAERQQLAKEVTQLRQQLAAATVVRETVKRDLVHYPTPIAKTVFADEVHFRLQGGRIAFVPLDSLLLKMKSQAQNSLSKLTEKSEVVDRVGPEEGFVMEYRLATQRVTVGDQQGVTAQFQGFVMLPENDLLGEPWREALREGSQFRSRLQRFVPEKTTISIWVYPDSYADFMELKSWLREQRFQIAGWPLEREALISGGPQGFRTSAQ